MKKCPYCAEEIQDEAIKCKHCGSMISDPKQPRGGESVPMKEEAVLNDRQKGQETTKGRSVLGWFIGISLLVASLCGMFILLSINSPYHKEKDQTVTVKFARDVHVTDPHREEFFQVQEKARAGDVSAMYELGRRYYIGDGVNKNYWRAIEEWERAARAGSDKAGRVLVRMGKKPPRKKGESDREYESRIFNYQVSLKAEADRERKRNNN